MDIDEFFNYLETKKNFLMDPYLMKQTQQNSLKSGGNILKGGKNLFEKGVFNSGGGFNDINTFNKSLDEDLRGSYTSSIESSSIVAPVSTSSSTSSSSSTAPSKTTGSSTHSNSSIVNPFSFFAVSSKPKSFK